MAARLAQNGRSLPTPSARGRVKTQTSSSFNFIMPIYTMCIILVFVFMIFKIMARSKGDKNRPDFDRYETLLTARSKVIPRWYFYDRDSYDFVWIMFSRLSYNEHSQLGQQGRQRNSTGVGQNNNFECPKRSRKNLRDGMNFRLTVQNLFCS